MIISIIFAIVSLTTFSGMVLYPKSSSRINGIKAVVVSIMATSCYLLVTCFLSVQLMGHISVFISCALLFVLSVGLWIGIHKKRQIQKLFWRTFDIIGLILCIIFVFAIAVHVYSIQILPQYSNSLGAEQFLSAMQIVNGNTDVVSRSFAAYLEAVFISVYMPFSNGIEYYKAFIVAEIFMRILEISMFYVVILTISDRKSIQYTAPIFSVCYFFGYPALSLLYGNYEYWNVGSLLLLFVVYILLVFEKCHRMRKQTVALLALAGITVFCSEQLFMSFYFVLIGLVISIICLKRRKEFLDRNKKLCCFGVCAGVDILAAFLFYREVFDVLQNTAVDGKLSEEIYRCMYGDLIFFLPGIFLVIAYVFFKRKGLVTVAASSVCMLAGTVVLYVLWYNFFIDTYFYFLNYYNLWTVGWIVAVMVIEIMAGSGQIPVFISYIGMIVTIGILTFTNYDYKMWFHNVDYNGQYVTKNFFSLYRQNLNRMEEDYVEYKISEQIFNAFKYLAENNANTGIVTGNEAAQYWNDAFTGGESEAYRLDKYEFPDIIMALDENSVKIVMAVKTEEEFSLYEQYYTQCNVVYETDEVMICMTAGESWGDILAMNPDYPQEKLELFSYIREKCQEERIPLMADKTAYMDYIMYRDMTGMDSDEFYTWRFSPVDNLKNLNEHGIKYICLLNDDEYYQSTKEYFDRQEVIFENEAGRILKCNGSVWETQY